MSDRRIAIDIQGRTKTCRLQRMRTRDYEGDNLNCPSESV